MVTITNGVTTCDVPTGAFNSIYKRQGWYKVKQKVYEEPAIIEKGSNVVDEGSVDAGLAEKPIGEWTKEEVSEFVKEHNIDTTGATKLNQVKKIVKEWIDENL